MKVKEVKPDYSLRALVHVMIPKFDTIQWLYYILHSLARKITKTAKVL